MHLNHKVSGFPEPKAGYPKITIFKIVSSDISGHLRHINVELQSVFDCLDGTMIKSSDKIQVIEFMFPQAGRKLIRVHDKNVLLLFRDMLTQILDAL